MGGNTEGIFLAKYIMKKFYMLFYNNSSSLGKFFVL